MRSRLGLNISIRCYIRRIIHSGKEFSWLVKREEQKTLSQRRVFNPPRISPSMRISYRSEEGRNSKEKGLLSPPTPRKQTRWIPRRHPRKSITSSSIPPVSILLSLHAPRHQRYPSDETVTISSRPWTASTSTETSSPRWCGDPRTSYQPTEPLLDNGFWERGPSYASLSLSLSFSSPIGRALVQGTREGRHNIFLPRLSFSHSVHPRGRKMVRDE